jgi:hypothetical protein
VGLWDLFKPKARPDPDPLPGVGGYDHGIGPTGAEGFPGSTTSTRTFLGASPRAVKLAADTNVGFEQGLSGVPQVRQQSARGDIELDPASPRATPVTATPQPDLTAGMQDDPREFFGGFYLRSRLGINDQPGGELTRRAARIARAPENDPRDTTTLWSGAQSQISLNVPGSANVRNQVAQRYKARPGEQHTYRSAPRPDQNRHGPLPSDSASGEWASVTEVTAGSRFVFAGGGVQTWSVQREMPYGGRGDGARGAELNGTRYYGTGQGGEFLNAGQGQYGAARLAGPRHRPTMFAEPAPWSANYYDTTPSVGTPGNPGPADQAPDLVYVSPQAGRASNGTGRTG